MLLTVKKQIEETVELKTPAYYKDYIDNYHFINESGQIITVRRKMVNMWVPEDGKVYNEEIEDLLRRGEPCTKEEFEKAYAEVISKLDEAVEAEEINS
jgi:hypothetical protein